MSDRLDILIFGAHPDDAEIGMGGTIAKHTRAGYRVGICDLTLAEMSSNGNVDTRREEAAEAGRILGLASRSNLGLPDRGLYMTKEHVDAITLEIRKFKPRIVFAPYWQDRHPDHVACSHLVQEAVFNAKLRRYLPDTEPVLVEQLYFYFINDVFDTDVLINVTDSYSSKTDALRAYASQFDPATGGNSYVATPLNQGYLERVEARDRLLGQKRMVPYAEGFVSKLPMIVDLF
ncbi:bacillithiol biosynthesis deacetylase BshB1 [Paenibacillus mesophilus]|uniref:bacillithiol biosynthesis deacetylase BshB1 n=1 Tax=Paenibacillus mesophilus TaxID=2582849 RepID=UPI00110D6B55|nr:bacillithiol biosynthesis deacetylase BshB1 [Paenibacillus mesophilus]TMV51243.1 bacillithiol biosynthesis deacetylase BshB1 [Paenibacillus mesophilus]